MGNPVVHFEIVSKDAERLHGFYGEVFDWKIDTDNPMGYGMVDTGEGVAGGIGAPPDPSSSGHLTFYVSVLDPDATLKRGCTVPRTTAPSACHRATCWGGRGGPLRPALLGTTIPEPTGAD